MVKHSDISSKENKYLKLVQKLQASSKERNQTGLFVLEGSRICDDALQNNLKIEFVFVSRSYFDKNSDHALKCFEKSRLNFTVEDKLFNKMCDTKTPQGIIFIAHKPALITNIDKDKKYLVLDGIQDTTNLGAISRTAEALGISGIILNDSCCDPYSPKTLRASMGTILRMPLFFTDNLPKFISENSLSAISLVVDKDAAPLDSVVFEQGDVIVIGNEANGVSEAVKGVSRLLSTIPMTGKTESLNAASAAAIAIYEYTK